MLMEWRAYADNMTDSMASYYRNERRRLIQQAYNDQNGVVPTPAGKKASNSILSFLELSTAELDGLMLIWLRL